MVSIHKRSQFWKSLPILILLMTFVSIVTLGQPPNRYHTETLANGLTVVVQEKRDSRVIGINLLVKERALSEGKDQWGMTEILQWRHVRKILT